MYRSTSHETPSQYPRVVENLDEEDTYPTPKTSSSVSPHYHHHLPPVVVVSLLNPPPTVKSHVFQATSPPPVVSLHLNPLKQFPPHLLHPQHCDPQMPQT